ncbi:hypothetical protein EI94DRAFT_1702491 [Lactarius quietus]|nr:hypothetical protein EI94DRAFT_1702491 [Lactarius quietus]
MIAPASQFAPSANCCLQLDRGSKITSAMHLFKREQPLQHGVPLSSDSHASIVEVEGVSQAATSTGRRICQHGQDGARTSGQFQVIITVEMTDIMWAPILCPEAGVAIMCFLAFIILSNGFLMPCYTLNKKCDNSGLRLGKRKEGCVITGSAKVTVHLSPRTPSTVSYTCMYAPQSSYSRLSIQRGIVPSCQPSASPPDPLHTNHQMGMRSWPDPDPLMVPPLMRNGANWVSYKCRTVITLGSKLHLHQGNPPALTRR